MSDQVKYFLDSVTNCACYLHGTSIILTHWGLGVLSGECVNSGMDYWNGGILEWWNGSF